MQLMTAKLISSSKIYHHAPEMMDLSINGVPYGCQKWGNAVPRGTLHSAHFPDLERRTHCSLATLGHDVKKLLLPTLKVPSSFSQCVSQDGGPHICTLLIVPSLHHIPHYLLFFHVIYIYISLALITVQPRVLLADPNLAISGANSSLSTDSSGLRIIKS